MKCHAPVVIALLIGMLCTGATFAHSHRRFFYGDDAAMTAGAGTALMTDTGAIWYNPAGLGGNHYQKLQISGTAYGLQVRNLNNVLQSNVDGRPHRVGTSIHGVLIVPSAFSIAFQLNDKVSFGVGLFQTGNDAIHLRAVQWLDAGSTGERWNAGIEYHEQTTQYTVGPALGIQFSNNFKWGIANFGVYDSVDASLRLHAGFDRDNTQGISDTMAIDSQYLHKQAVGTLFTTGFQWRVSKNWHTGLLLRSPVFRLWHRLNVSQFDAITYDNTMPDAASTHVANGGVLFDYGEDSKSGFDLRAAVPGEVLWSIAYGRGNSWVGSEIAYQFPLKKENHRGVFNANLGAHIRLLPKVGLGIGFFTDNDSQRQFDGTLTKPGNRLGATAGIQLRSAELVERVTREPHSHPGTNPKNVQKQKRRVLITTISVTYSLQAVTYQTIGFAANSSNQTFSLGLGSNETIFRRCDIHLGGGFYF